MARDSIKLWKSYIDAALYLPDKERLAYYDALFAYGIYEEEPQLDGVAAAMFVLTKPNIDKSIMKANAGQKGGSCSGAESKLEADDKQTESKLEADDKQTESKPQPNREERRENREERIESIENPPYIPPEGASVTVQEHPDDDFEAFWSLYPKKKSKGDARKAWKQLKPSATTIRAIMAKLQELIGSRDWKRDNGQFIPYPATWLRAEGWNDEVGSMPEKEPWHYDYGTDEGYVGL